VIARARVLRLAIRLVAAGVAATAVADAGAVARARASAAAEPAFPLRMGPTHRYLVDRQGKPFLIVGDSPQSLIVDLSEQDANRFFADRQAAGFNAVWINLLRQTYTGGRADAATYDGIAPFAKADDLSTPNPPSHPITVAMSAMSGRVEAQRYDPTNGRYLPIGNALSNSGKRRFTPPATNAGGDGDWVLVLRTSA
jgi:hypothetical protein